MRERILMALAAAVLMACGSSPERERVDFERMRLQQRADVYGSSSVFPNQADMQTPPSGTVSRETRGDTGVVGSGTVGGTAVTSVPLALTPEQRAAGAKDFRIYCAVCHGPAGYGGSTVAENMGPPRPPSLRSARLLAAPAGYIYAVATHGLGRMPSYAAELSTTERWAVVAYVKKLQATPSLSMTREQIEDSLRALAIQHTDSAAAARGKS